VKWLGRIYVPAEVHHLAAALARRLRFGLSGETSSVARAESSAAESDHDRGYAVEADGPIRRPCGGMMGGSTITGAASGIGLESHALRSVLM
jgi:hypothetical protein